MKYYCLVWICACASRRSKRARSPPGFLRPFGVHIMYVISAKRAIVSGRSGCVSGARQTRMSRARSPRSTIYSRRTRRPKCVSTPSSLLSRVTFSAKVGFVNARSAHVRRRIADGYRVCLQFLSLASDQGGSPAEFKHISKRRKRN